MVEFAPPESPLGPGCSHVCLYSWRYEGTGRACWGGLGGGGEEAALHLRGKALTPSELRVPGTWLTLEGSLAPWAEQVCFSSV